MEAYNKRTINEYKEKIILNSLLARQIGENIAALFDKENKITPLWDFYPDMFSGEKEKFEQEQRETKWKVYKAQMEAYMTSKGVK